MREPSGSSFGSVLRFFRRREKLTQRELAKKLEVHENSVGWWEREEGLPESHRVVSKMAELFHLNEVEKRLLFEARYGTASLLPLYNIPFDRNPYFTGRETLLQHLHEQLTSRKQIVLKQAISGLGGIGKTQTALEYAYRYRGSYHDILWAAADSVETLTSSYVNLAECLHLREKDVQDQNVVVGAVKRWLSTHEGWLLILDNIEDLTLVKRFIPSGRQGSVLLTTQRQVTAPIAHSIELDSMSDEEGALFLLRRAHYLGLSGPFDKAILDEETITLAKTFSQEVGGLPLALDQAGAYILEAGCSLPKYLALYRQQRDKLLQQRGSLYSDHPASVTTTFALAFNRVTQENDAASELLSLFAFLASDDIPEDILLRGAPDLGPKFQSLVNDELALNEAIKILRAFSLISITIDERTFRVHRLVQVVLKDMMSKETQQLWAERAVRAIERAAPARTNWQKSQRYHLHLQQGVELARKWGMTFFEVTELYNQYGLDLWTYTRYTEAERLFQQALDIRKRIFGDIHPEVATLLNNLALLHDERGFYTRAEHLYQQAQEIWEKALGSNDPHVATCLANLAECYRQQSKYEQAKSLYQRALTIEEQALGSNHPSVAQTLNNLAVLYSNEGRFEQAELLHQRALVIREQQLGIEHPLVAETLGNLAHLYVSQGQYSRAEPLLVRTLTIYEQAFGVDNLHTAVVLSNFGWFYAEQHQYDRASQLYLRALSIREKRLELEPSDTVNGLSTALILNNLAMAMDNQGKYEQAEAYYQRSLFIKETVLGARDPSIATTLNNLAHLYREIGRYREAEPLFLRALAIREENADSNPLDLADNLTTLAELYEDLAQYKQAEEVALRALSIRESILSPDHPDLASSFTVLAGIYHIQGRYDEAEQLYQRALDIRETAFGREHPLTASSLHNLGLIYNKQGKYEQAEALYLQALTIKEKTLGPDHPEVATTLNNLARLYRIKGKYIEAEPLHQQALTIRRKILGPTHPDVASILKNLARLYHQQRKLEQAEELYKDALAIFNQALGPLHPQTARTRRDYSVLLQEMGKQDEV
ncbi:MAG TPA: tetratricopeptide repeat protein [Ktedonobacteraceae bacterium]|nr:tetratricopeptide repeat protein [Ktedonobacteraceae bacterium]